MGLHLVQRGARKVEDISSPTVDLASGASPEDLVEHNVGLRGTLRKYISVGWE